MPRMVAIDPGNIESAYVVVDANLKPLKFGKVENALLIKKIREQDFWGIERVVIEGIASYGMAVGAEVFQTCVWSGRFYQALDERGAMVEFIYRKDVKLQLCGTTRAKDSNIIQALKDRFGDKGTKANPGWFFGFSKDVWQAYGCCVAYSDSKREAAS